MTTLGMNSALLWPKKKKEDKKNSTFVKYSTFGGKEIELSYCFREKKS